MCEGDGSRVHPALSLGLMPQLRFADTYYGEMMHYGLYRLAWADTRRTRN